MSINKIDINNEFLVYINNFFDGKFKLVNKIDKFSCDNLSFFEKKLLVSEWIRKIYMTDFSIEGAKKKVKNSYGDLIENNKTRFYSEIFKYYLRSIYYDFLPICILNYGEMNKDLFELKNKMNKWLKDKKFEGYSLYVQGGYRSLKEQMDVKNKELREERKKLIADSGHSEHHTGLAIDFGLRLNKIDIDMTKYNNICFKLSKIAPRYGFILRYGANKELFTGYEEEKWHYTYIGDKDICRTMYRYNLSVEEYLIASFILKENMTLDEFIDAGLLEVIIPKENVEKLKENRDYFKCIENYLYKQRLKNDKKVKSLK